MERFFTVEQINRFRQHLYEEEKSPATIEKYMRDLRKLEQFARGRELTKTLMIAYKTFLKEQGYEISSMNSFLVAVNRMLDFLGWYDLRVKLYQVQREVFASENQCLTVEEYKRLVTTAARRGKRRLAMMLQAICATGIRISELSFLTVASVQKGEMKIQCKGKIRRVLLTKDLQRALLRYIKKQGIREGVVFRTSGGKAVNRSNIWKEMKALCKEADVEQGKVYPHNLRHLFAQIFYDIKKDIAKLADVLGHSSIETTRLYIKTSSKEHRKQLERMGLVLRI